jgi:hypothetical protein
MLHSFLVHPGGYDCIEAVAEGKAFEGFFFRVEEPVVFYTGVPVDLHFFQAVFTDGGRGKDFDD